MEPGQITGLYGEVSTLPALLSAHVTEEQLPEMRIYTVSAGERPLVIRKLRQWRIIQRIIHMTGVGQEFYEMVLLKHDAPKVKTKEMKKEHAGTASNFSNSGSQLGLCTLGRTIHYQSSVDSITDARREVCLYYFVILTVITGPLCMRLSVLAPVSLRLSLL